MNPLYIMSTWNHPLLFMSKGSYYCSTAATVIGSIVSQEVEIATRTVEISSNPAYETVTSSKKHD